MQKDQTSFWKTWKAKFSSKAGFAEFIDDSNNASVIADTVACMFEGACSNNFSESNKRLLCEFTTTQDEYFYNFKYDANVDKCLHAMKLEKAAGCDGIETEHMVIAHPILVSLLAALFIPMLQHGYVPDNLIGELLVP